MTDELGPTRTVLHVIVPQREGAIGGADLHVLDLAKQQKSDGWRPWVLVPRAPDHYVRLLREAGLDVITSPMRQVARVAHLPRELDVDIVHAHGYESNYLVAALRIAVPSWRRVPTVTTAHGWIETGTWLRIKSSLDRLSARSAHVRIASARAHSGRMWTGRGENFVVHNGVPVSDLHSGAEDSQPRVIGSVGRLSPEKRVDLTIRASARLVEAGHDVRLLIVGSGAERDKLRELVTELHMEGRVTFRGLVDDPDPSYAVMHVLVQASDTEGTPRTVIEAMARSVPVVATRVGDVAELLADGECGLLVTPGDDGELADAIGRLLFDRDLASAIAKRAETRYRENYTIGEMARRVEICYETATRIARRTDS